jgi:hypothetical protein
MYGWNYASLDDKMSLFAELQDEYELYSHNQKPKGPFHSIEAAKEDAIKTIDKSVEIFELIPMTVAEQTQEILCATDIPTLINNLSPQYYGWNLNFSIPKESLEKANSEFQSFLESWVPKYIKGKICYKPGKIVERFAT